MGLSNSSASVIAQPFNALPAIPGNGANTFGNRSNGRSADGVSQDSFSPFYTDTDDGFNNQNSKTSSSSSSPISFPDSNLGGNLFENPFYAGPNNIFNLNRGPFITNLATGGSGGSRGGSGEDSGSGSSRSGSDSFSSRFNSAQNNPFNRTFGNLANRNSDDSASSSAA